MPHDSQLAHSLLAHSLLAAAPTPLGPWIRPPAATPLIRVPPTGALSLPRKSSLFRPTDGVSRKPEITLTIRAASRLDKAHLRRTRTMLGLGFTSKAALTLT